MPKHIIGISGHADIKEMIEDFKLSLASAGTKDSGRKRMFWIPTAQKPYQVVTDHMEDTGDFDDLAEAISYYNTLS